MFVQIVVNSRKRGIIHAEGFIKWRVFVSLSIAGAASIYLIVKLRIRDMEFKRRYTENRSILLMKLDEFEGVFTAEDNVVVELIPSNGSLYNSVAQVRNLLPRCKRGNLRAWELPQRTKKQAVD